MSRRPLTGAERKALARRIVGAYDVALRALQRADGWKDLERARELAAAGERRHRATGRRMCSATGGIRPRVSVDTCSRLFALRGLATLPGERSFGDREDFVAAYAAAERIESMVARAAENPDRDGKWAAAARDAAAVIAGIRAWISDVDYVDLIGE